MPYFTLDVEKNNVVRNGNFDFGQTKPAKIAEWLIDPNTWTVKNIGADAKSAITQDVGQLIQSCLVEGDTFDITIDVEITGACTVQVLLGLGGPFITITSSGTYNLSGVADSDELIIWATVIPGGGIVQVNSISAEWQNGDFPIKIEEIQHNQTPSIECQRGDLLKGFTGKVQSPIQLGINDTRTICDLIDLFKSNFKGIFKYYSDCDTLLFEGVADASNISLDWNGTSKLSLSDVGPIADIISTKGSEIDVYQDVTFTGLDITHPEPTAHAYDIIDPAVGQSINGFGWTVSEVLDHLLNVMTDGKVTATGLFHSGGEFEAVGIATGRELRGIRGDGLCNFLTTTEVEAEEYTEDITLTSLPVNSPAWDSASLVHVVGFDSEQSYAAQFNIRQNTPTVNGIFRLALYVNGAPALDASGSPIPVFQTFKINESETRWIVTFEALCLSAGDTVQLFYQLDIPGIGPFDVYFGDSGGGSPTPATFSNFVINEGFASRLSFSKLVKLICYGYGGAGYFTDAGGGNYVLNIVKHIDLFDVQGPVYFSFDNTPDVIQPVNLLDNPKSVSLGFTTSNISGLVDRQEYIFDTQKNNGQQLNLTSDFIADLDIINGIITGESQTYEFTGEYDNEWFVFDYGLLTPQREVISARPNHVYSMATAMIATRLKRTLYSHLRNPSGAWLSHINSRPTISANLSEAADWVKDPIEDFYPDGEISFRYFLTPAEWEDIKDNLYKKYELTKVEQGQECKYKRTGFIKRIKYNPHTQAADITIILERQY